MDESIRTITNITTYYSIEDLETRKGRYEVGKVYAVLLEKQRDDYVEEAIKRWNTSKDCIGPAKIGEK